MPLTAESLDVLDKVKKGTPARYVLLTKGVKVLNLVVYRKGSLETVKNEAKKAGTGDFSYGVVDGSGQALSFKLARVDGFEKAPVKDTTLKDFLKASKVDCKPTIDIVDTLPELVEQVAPQAPPQNRPSSTTTTTTTSTAPKTTTAPKMPPLPETPKYRTQEQWDKILATVGNAPSGPARQTALEKVVAELKREREQVEKDAYLTSDPAAKQQQTGIHAAVAYELKSLMKPPTSGGDGSAPQAPPQRPQTTTAPKTEPSMARTYRTQEQWDKILATVGNTPSGPARQTALEKVVAELKREREQVENDPLLMSDPYAKQQQTGIHAAVTHDLKSLLAPPKTGEPPKQVPPQAPPQKSPDDKARDTMLADAKRRAGSWGAKVEVPYKISKLKEMRTECETDETSDFGKVTVALSIVLKDSYDVAVQKLLQATELAQKYIKDHPDPKIGKLPSRVIKRRDYCQQFLPKIKTMLDQVRAAEEGAKAMAQSYGKLLEKQQPIPSGVADEMYKILETARLSDGTRAELKRIADEIRTADQARAYTRLAGMQNPTDLEKAEILLSHGCYKAGGGGTSDVRLLRNQDKSVAFAYKSAKGESTQALDFLKLPPGAGATREDLCSTLTQDILSQTGIDFGFPKSQVTSFSGESGALIDGIRGKTVDPEELSKLQSSGGSQEEIDELKKRLREIPDKVSAKSLQNVALFTALSCQWDCKWGNLMVENDTDARPIDGGGAFPTQECIDEFGRDYEPQPVGILCFTMYPTSNYVPETFGKTLPQALQPMDAETVQGLLKLDVDKLIQTLKRRRDEIVQKHPDLAPPPHTAGLVDDATLDRMKASIKATQDILRQNPSQTLVDFGTAYQNWWVQWIKDNRRPNAVLYGAPQPDTVGATV